MQSVTPQTRDFVVVAERFAVKDLLTERDRLESHQFLLECTEPRGCNVGRFSASLRRRGLLD
jgi:hypothetical protein